MTTQKRTYHVICPLLCVLHPRRNLLHVLSDVTKSIESHLLRVVLQMPIAIKAQLNMPSMILHTTPGIVNIVGRGANKANVRKNNPIIISIARFILDAL